MFDSFLIAAFDVYECSCSSIFLLRISSGLLAAWAGNIRAVLQPVIFPPCHAHTHPQRPLAFHSTRRGSNGPSPPPPLQPFKHVFKSNFQGKTANDLKAWDAAIARAKANVAHQMLRNTNADLQVRMWLCILEGRGLNFICNSRLVMLPCFLTIPPAAAACVKRAQGARAPSTQFQQTKNTTKQPQ